MKKLFFLAFYLLVWPVLFFAYGAELVDINTAPLAQLDNLVGIGPALGQRIIDNRPYNSIDDLLKIKGIGPKNLEKIKQQGLACVNCQALAASTSTESTEKTNNENPTTTQEKLQNLSDRSSFVMEKIAGIFINEVLPSPEGADTENEFIELFNANNFEADVSGFKIKDKIGAIKTFAIPNQTKILANGFLVFTSKQTKISLNNNGDGVELLDPNGKIIDSTDFDKSQSGLSWSKTEQGWQWTAKPTPNQANVIVAIQVNATSSAFLATSSRANNLTANIQNYPAQKKNLLAVGIALIIALFSAYIAWRIKKNATEI